MAYCVPEDLGRFGINAAALEDTPAEDQMEPVIDSWAGYMDSYLGKQFTLPLLIYGKELTNCNSAFAARNLLDVRGRKPGENPEDQAIDLECDRWQKWLEQIAAGKVTPVVTPSPSPTTGSTTPGGPLVMSNYSRGWQDDIGAAASGIPFAGRRRF
jgi:hypothetical protein